MAGYKFNEGVNFIYNETIINTTPLVIDTYIELIGNMLVLEGDIYIRCNSIFVNVDFVRSTIYIENSSNVEFENCSFTSKSTPSIVLRQNSNSSLSISKSTFTNTNISIIANNNIIKSICDTTFKLCTTAIEIVGFLYLERINNNLLFSFKDSLFINILCNSYDFFKSLSLSSSLSQDNNNGVVMCLVNDNTLIKTTFHFVSSYYELICAIDKCTNGSTIMLKANSYYGDINIKNSITLIGENGTVFVPTYKQKNLAAFIISASMVVIKNVEIMPFEDLRFRDGIKFSSEGGDYCYFENIMICNVRRRGISIWGRGTLNTEIVNCEFRDIVNTGIFLWGKVVLRDLVFTNCYVSLVMISPTSLVIEGCSFQDVFILISVDDPHIASINLQGNEFTRVTQFVSTINK